MSKRGREEIRRARALAFATESLDEHLARASSRVRVVTIRRVVARHYNKQNTTQKTQPKRRVYRRSASTPRTTASKLGNVFELILLNTVSPA